MILIEFNHIQHLDMSISTLVEFNLFKILFQCFFSVFISIFFVQILLCQRADVFKRIEKFYVNMLVYNLATCL